MDFDDQRIEAGAGERSSVLPALAEVHRRAGRLDEAEQVARRGIEFDGEHADARLVLALVLMDRGRVEAAAQALAPLTDAMLARHGLDQAEAPPTRPDWDADAPAVSEDEFEAAFAQARPEREQMIDADDIAQRAMRHADLEEEDEEPEATPFMTHTVADLLERQGDARGADQIRSALAARPEEETAPALDPVLGELERWLVNLQRPRG